MAKNESDRLKKVEIWWLKKYGYLDGWKSGGIQWNNSWTGRTDSISIEVSTMNEEDYIRFHYSQTEDDGEKKDYNYKARLVSSPCNYGGKRYWFVCPLVKNGVACNRRVGVLYKDGNYFGCRHCYELTYKSKNENRKSKYYYLFRILDINDKMEELEDKIKRTYYAGKPTRKYKRIMRAHQRAMPYYDLLRKKNGL